MLLKNINHIFVENVIINKHWTSLRNNWYSETLLCATCIAWFSNLTIILSMTNENSENEFILRFWSSQKWERPLLSFEFLTGMLMSPHKSYAPTNFVRISNLIFAWIGIDNSGGADHTWLSHQNEYDRWIDRGIVSSFVTMLFITVGLKEKLALQIRDCEWSIFVAHLTRTLVLDY